MLFRERFVLYTEVFFLSFVYFLSLTATVSHTGRIGVRSTGVPGEGTEFLLALRLPVLASGQDIPTAQPLFSKPAPYQPLSNAGAATFISKLLYPRPMRILVVDDALSNRKLLVRMIVNALKHVTVTVKSEVYRLELEIVDVEDGHLAVTAVTGADPFLVSQLTDTSSWPLAWICPQQCKLEYFDWICMDAQMPTMSGYDSTQLLRAVGYKGDIYACTANVIGSDIERFLNVGATHVFPKPIELDKFISAALQNLSPVWGVRFERN